MNGTGEDSYFERYKPWQALTVLQRRLLHVCALSVMVVILASTFDSCRVVVEWPAVVLGLTTLGPPPLWADAPADSILAYDTGNAFLNFALGEMAVYFYTIALVAIAYTLIVLARRWARRITGSRSRA